MLKRSADYITFDLFGLTPGTRLGEALDFFLYDTTKIFLLLATIIYVVAIIRSSFPQTGIRGPRPGRAGTTAGGRGHTGTQNRGGDKHEGRNHPLSVD